MIEDVALTDIDGDFAGKDVVSISQFTKTDVEQVMVEAEAMAKLVRVNGRSQLLQDKLIAVLFYEPSTRTYLSFESAAKRLGAATISTQGAETSSISKGETLEDTIRVVERYVDVICMRHSQAGVAKLAANAATKPVINGGDGVGEHPTQALLDLFTIREKTSKPLDQLRVTMLGDLKNGRTVHSLSRLLAMYGVKLNLVAPEGLRMPKDVLADLKKTNTVNVQTEKLDDVLQNTDVLYVTRVQKERFTDQAEYERLKHQYIITLKVMAQADSEMIVMHPLPRVGEIDPQIDADSRAVYFDQAENGMFVRMALLALVCGRSIVK